MDYMKQLILEKKLNHPINNRIQYAKLSKDWHKPMWNKKLIVNRIYMISGSNK